MTTFADLIWLSSSSESLSSSTSFRPIRSCDPSKNPQVDTRHCRLSIRNALMPLTICARVMGETVGLRSSSKDGSSGTYGYCAGKDQCIRMKAIRSPLPHGPFIVIVSFRWFKSIYR